MRMANEHVGGLRDLAYSNEASKAILLVAAPLCFGRRSKDNGSARRQNARVDGEQRL